MPGVSNYLRLCRGFLRKRHSIFFTQLLVGSDMNFHAPVPRATFDGVIAGHRPLKPHAHDAYALPCNPRVYEIIGHRLGAAFGETDIEFGEAAIVGMADHR